MSKLNDPKDRSERLILTGLITSTEFLQQIQNSWNIQYIESPPAKRIAGWIWAYFEHYNKAPGNIEIENIFFTRSKNLPKADAEDVEGLLSEISKDYENLESFNIQYAVDETQKYFQERNLYLLLNNGQGHLRKGNIAEAEKLILDYKPIANASESDLDLSSDTALDRVEKAFNITNIPVLTYPKQLGEFWNAQLVRGGLVALMASEKRGKTFLLMDMAIRACKGGKNVCFFQAGDMTESQQIKRICIYLAQKSDQQRYCGKMWEPVRDCILNQTGQCKCKEQTSEGGVFKGELPEFFKQEVSIEDLIYAYEAEENKDYLPCTACDEYDNKALGAVWIKKVDVGDTPLEAEEAKKVMSDFFIKHKRHFKLSSHANGTLSVKQIRALLSVWEKQDEFVPDLIVIDYADLLVGETKEFRHLQNEIWKNN